MCGFEVGGYAKHQGARLSLSETALPCSVIGDVCLIECLCKRSSGVCARDVCLGNF
jgi:hypothetical protein